MRKLLTIIFVLFTFVSFAQNKETIKRITVEQTGYTGKLLKRKCEKIQHKWYFSYFSDSLHIPIYVSYTLRKNMICEGTQRNDQFAKDPKSPIHSNVKQDYLNSGYDKGHLMPFLDNSCDQIAITECFYMTNMFPQSKNLNEHVWEALEEQERVIAKSEDSIFVVIGWYQIGGESKIKGKFVTSTKIGKDSVAVPKFCWKGIYSYKTKTWTFYQMPNIEQMVAKGKDIYVPYKMKQSDMEKELGIKFN
jgi:endonuclease G